jgi:hypothetical protein
LRGQRVRATQPFLLVGKIHRVDFLRCEHRYIF